MDRTKALTLSFTVDKYCLVSIRGSDSKPKRRSPLKKGIIPFDHNQTTMVNWGLARGKAQLVLTKTREEKNCKEITKCQEAVKSKKSEGTIVQRESPRHKEAAKEAQRDDKETDDKEKLSTPRSRRSGTTSTLKRSRLFRKLQNVEKEDEVDNKEVQEVMMVKDKAGDCNFSDEVVDCGLSVSWNSAEDDVDSENFDPVVNKDVESDQQNESQSSVKRKRKETSLGCKGTSNTKRLRQTVLCFTEEREKNSRSAPVHSSQEEYGDDCRNSDDATIKCTLEERAEILPPTTPESNQSDRMRSPKRRRLSRGSITKSCSSVSITLSSDEDDDDAPGSICHSPTYSGAKPQEDVQVIPVIVGDAPVVEMPSLSVSHSMTLPFTMVLCGGYQAKSSGDLLFENERIIIPITDMDEELYGQLTLERKELMHYSVWDLDDVDQLDCTSSHEDFPADGLLFFVSRKAAAKLSRDIRKVFVSHPPRNTGGTASPFILLSLDEPLCGMEGALLRSILELDCLNSIASEKHSDFAELESKHGPLLTLEESLHLIHQSGLDPSLLDVLGYNETDCSSATSTSSKAVQKVPEAPEEERTERAIELIPELLELPLSDPETPSPLEDERTSLSSSRQDVSQTCLTTQAEAGISEQTFELDKNENEELDIANKLLDATSSKLEAGLEQVMSPSVDPSVDPSVNSFGVPLEGEINPETNEKETLEPPAEKEEEKPVYTMCHRRVKDSFSVSMCKLDTSWTKYRHQGMTRRLIQFPPPPIKGGITVTMEDLQCLDSGQYLNDVIIDFYLKYLLQMSDPAMVERSHIFSSFFFKQLTRRDNASEGNTSESCQRQRRHQRVKTWTRHVDIFKKDFVFVPVNQEAHWYLVVICFPGLEEVRYEGHPSSSECPAGSDHDGEHPDEAQKSKSFTLDSSPEPEVKKHPPPPVNCTEKTYTRKVVCKRPCILIMDSLKLSLHERVFKLIRDYLQSEWEARRGTSRDFSPEQMKSSHSLVPLQDNSSDCGLYLLQYVETFLEDPVVHFDLPLQLQRWFPRQQVRRKRDDIRDLVLKLHRDQNLDGRR